MPLFLDAFSFALWVIIPVKDLRMRQLSDTAVHSVPEVHNSLEIPLCSAQIQGTPCQIQQSSLNMPGPPPWITVGPVFFPLKASFFICDLMLVAEKAPVLSHHSKEHSPRSIVFLSILILVNSRLFSFVFFPPVSSFFESSATHKVMYSAVRH